MIMHHPLTALTGISYPQTIKLIGCIKHWKFIVLVDSGSTHNFIYRFISHKTMLYIWEVNHFQIMISNGNSMKHGGRCENVHLQIGHYHLKSHMFVINMGSCNNILRVEWLLTLGPITMDFKELTMKFK
jgi:hypothetical protein